MQFFAISKMDLDLYLNHSNANITSNMIPKAKVLQKILITNHLLFQHLQQYKPKFFMELIPI